MLTTSIAVTLVRSTRAVNCATGRCLSSVKNSQVSARLPECPPESLLSSRVVNRLEELKSRHEDLIDQLSQSSNPPHSLAKESSNLKPLIIRYEKWLELVDTRKELTEMAKMAEMKEIAEMDIEETDKVLRKNEKRLMNLLTPLDPLDFQNALLEIRAGVGGDEASLFAADLLRMYERYATIRRGWTTEVISSTPEQRGGFKEIIMQVKNNISPQRAFDAARVLSDDPTSGRVQMGPFGTLRFEAGVHRVQRTPLTETAGRVHTSTASVIVLPNVEDDSSMDVEIAEQDVRTDTMRASGKGGQHVNTTSSAVRLTHIPTGIVVSMQNERSQHQNKAKAWQILRARLADRREKEREQRERHNRSKQVRGTNRSDKSRTYNYAQNRVTDHRIGFHLHDLEGCMEGHSLESIIAELRQRHLDERLEREL